MNVKVEPLTQTQPPEPETSASHMESGPRYTAQTLPSMGTRFDVTVTQVDQPNIVYIQRYPVSGESGDVLFVDDSGDDTAENAYTELAELEEISYNINSENYFGDDERVASTQVRKGICILFLNYNCSFIKLLLKW